MKGLPSSKVLAAPDFCLASFIVTFDLMPEISLFEIQTLVSKNVSSFPASSFSGSCELRLGIIVTFVKIRARAPGGEHAGPSERV